MSKGLEDLPLSTSEVSLSQGGMSNSQEIFTVIVEPSRILYTNRSGELTLYYIVIFCSNVSYEYCY